MNDLKKAEVLVGHWIEHGREHAAIYEEWAEKIGSLDGGAEMASALRAAAVIYQRTPFGALFSERTQAS